MTARKRPAPEATTGWKGAIAKVIAYEEKNDFVLAITGIVQAALLFVGAIIGYHQWQINNALELGKQWTSTEMQNRRDRILDANIGFDIYKDTKQRLIFVQKISASDVPPLLDFFDQVHSCIHSGLCNKHTACNMFSGEAEKFNGIFSRYLNIVKIKLSLRTWGGSFTRVVADCVGVKDDDEKSNVEPIINNKNMTPEERVTYNEMSRDINDQNSLTYDIITQACKRISDEDRTKSGCSSEAEKP